VNVSLAILARGLVLLTLAPLLPGLITRFKSWVAGRRGPPLLQLYYDLGRLGRKSVVLSVAASPWHIAGIAVAWVSLLAAALLLPLGPWASPLAFRGDAVLFVYLLALSRFCTALSALDVGSAFTGMGTAREVSYAVIAEAAVIAGLLALAVQNRSVSLSVMLAPAAGTSTVLLAGGLFIILLVENCRVPFDDPNTHLELTMIHEVMILDHSGPPLGLVFHGAALKLLVFALLLSQAVLPLGAWPEALAGVLLVGSTILVAVAVGLTESVTARLAFLQIPMLLTTGFLLCLFALMLAWKGGSW
jgi:formate hydrogenlyase subunit 4